MSKRPKKQTGKPNRFSRIGNIIKSMPKWLKFAGLVVPILGLIISFLSYALERQKYTDEIEVVASTESAIDFEHWGKMHVSPPGSVTIIAKNELICGHNLIVSNIGGIPTALIGFEGNLQHDSFSKPITFESVGNEIYLTSIANSLPEEMTDVYISILKDTPWIMDSKSFKDEDVLSFPLDVQAHSSFKIRVAIKLRYETDDIKLARFLKFTGDSRPDEKRLKFSLQFHTSTSKVTKSVEFTCFTGVYFFPGPTPIPTPNSP